MKTDSASLAGLGLGDTQLGGVDAGAVGGARHGLPRGRARAIGFAVVAWFVLVVGTDLAAIALLSVLPAHTATSGLVVLLTANPVDSAGAALHRLLGGPGAVRVLAGLVAWTIIPLWLAGRRFARHDL